MKKFIFLLLLIINIFFIINNTFAENIYFSTRAAFSDSQFWERHENTEHSATDPVTARKIFSNFFSGSIGLGMEMIIWDIGKKRGSRIFFKTGIDMVFSGISTVAYYNENEDNPETQLLDIEGGAFYMGLDWDIFIGGSIPKTDLIWGFGCIFTFLFPTYAPAHNVQTFREYYLFYAAPTILFGYDIFIPMTDFKITPQMRVGFTCNPLIPDDLLQDTTLTGGKFESPSYGGTDGAGMYSGLYIDLSVAFSFFSIEWKD